MENVNQWYFTKDQLANTPSRKHDIDAAKELSYRQQAANFIQDMGQRLQVTQLCINTAIVYMHRFYIFHSFKEVHRNNISISSLFLAAKVEEQPRKLEHVIKVAHMCLHKEASPLDVKCEPYQDKVNETVAHENVLLQTLGFVLAIEHPHTYVVKVCQLVKASKELAQSSYIMATTSLHMTTMCLQYKPTVVACVCIHLACKWSSYMIEPCSEGRDWFYYVDRSVTWELLERLTQEYISILERSPHRFKNKFGKQDASGYHGPNSDCVLPSIRASTSSGSIEYNTLPAILDSMPSSIHEQPTGSDKEAKPSTNSEHSDKYKGKLLFTNPKEKSNSNHSEAANAIKPKEESSHSRQLPSSTSVANVLNTVQSTFFQSATKPLSPLEKIDFNFDRVSSKSDGIDSKHEKLFVVSQQRNNLRPEKIEVKQDVRADIKVDRTDIKNEKADAKIEKAHVKIEADVKINKADIKIEKAGIKIEQPFVKLDKIEIKPDKINLSLMGVDVKREKAAVKADKPPSSERKHKSKHSSKDKSSSNADKSSSNHHKPGIKIKIPKDIISRVPESSQKYSVPSRPDNPKEPLKIKLPIPPTQREPPKEASTSLKLVITKDKFGSGSYSTSQKHHDRENRKRVHSSSNLVLDGAAHHRNSEMPSKHQKVDHMPKSRHDDSSRSGKVSRRNMSDHSAKAAAGKHNDGTTFHNYNVSTVHQNYYPMIHPHMQRVHGLPVDRTNSNPPLPPPVPPPPPPPEEHGYRNGL